MTVGKLFHRHAAPTANEQSPALVRGYASFLTCYCSQSAVFLSVDTSTRVHINTLARRCACNGIVSEYKQLEFNSAHNGSQWSSCNKHCRYAGYT